ncbi:hypothetical protein GQ55_3G091500 [Panicum hallii var. hallii]|uniref:Nudix hydrolase domain-containing protein n=1 Tax=Panicum hallii var. hallii TaxID=1504633 RepID=A0A2T7E7C6_9POAL|nr:hypothetical protein GQ55_3G091500 [Panicum hallii var. hallii]PUZ63737.1 hypothetical protein GQ55_3G091500 [Panicum hallii var. hallii]
MAATASAADPGTAFKLLLSCPAGLPRSRVSVKFGQSFDRIPHPDAALEESISEIWNQRLQWNPSLYNGTKFRYGGHAVHYKDDSKEEYCVLLHLGLTDYRTFVGTNLNPLWENFLVPSEDDSVRCQHMSNPLGNGAIVETSDQKIIVLQRSHNVGEFPGYYVFPGGHSETSQKKSALWAIKLMKKTWLLSLNEFHKRCLMESSVKWLRKLEFLLVP